MVINIEQLKLRDSCFWPPCVVDVDIIFSSRGFFFFLLSFFSSPNLSCHRLDIYHTSTHDVVLVRIYNARLKCAARGSLKIRDAKIAKKSPSGHHHTLAISLQLRHVSTIGNKIIKQQYLLHMSPQHGELQPTNGWDLLASLGHPSKFQPVSHLGFVTGPTSLDGGQQNFAGCLAVSWAGTLYIHFWRLLPCNGILTATIFTLRPSLAFSYIGSVTARHSSSGRQPNFVTCMVQRMELRNFRGERHLY